MDSSTKKTSARLQAALGATLVGTGVALTDYLDSPRHRALAYAGLMGAGIGVIGMLPQGDGSRYLFPDDSTLLNDQLRQELGDLGVTPGPASDYEGIRGPVATWLYIGVFLLFAVLIIRLDMAFTKRLARALSRRGVSRPYSVLGIFYAATSYVTCEFDMRSRRASRRASQSGV